MSTQKAWLPNLVGGVSVWKLADDLNAPSFMDGRLLIPETEGAESLPTEVRWNVDGLIPLAEAQAQRSEDAAVAITDFRETLARVDKMLGEPESGYTRFRDAFTMPSIDAAGEAQYFFDPEKKRLRVKNWGASPRDLAGGKEAVFGIGRLADVFAKLAPAAAAVVGSAAAVAASGVSAAAESKEEKPALPKEEEKKTPWAWIIAVVLGILLLVALLLGLRECNPTDAPDAGPDASDAGDASDAADAAEDAADASDAGEDAGEDAGDDAGDAGDGGVTALLFDDDVDVVGGNTIVHGGGGGGGTIINGGGGGGGGTISGGGAGGKEKVYNAPDKKPGAYKRNYTRDGATAWRVSQGADRVAKALRKGNNFDVWVADGATFEGVVVEWRDKDGNWHVH